MVDQSVRMVTLDQSVRYVNRRPGSSSAVRTGAGPGRCHERGWANAAGRRSEGEAVPRSKAFDDATAVAAARDVFWEHGYASTSLTQLQAATGLSKSSLYETYGSKRGLFDRAAQSYLEVVIAPRLGPLEAEGAGRAELMAYFSGLAAFFGQAPDRIARRGCLLLNTAMELTELDPAAAELVRGYRLRVRTAFARVAHTMFLEPRSSISSAPELTTSSNTPAPTRPTTSTNSPAPAQFTTSTNSPISPAAEAERRAELLTAGQIGLMLTSRLDPGLAAELAGTIADDVRSW